MSKRMKVVFTLSLMLNIIFIGVGAGLLYRFCQDVPIAGDMSPDARHFVARTFQEGREEAKPLITEVKAHRAIVEKIIMAPNFDKKAYDEEVGKMLDARDKMTRHRANVMGKALSELSQDDREKFAKRALDGLEGRKPHKKGGYGHPDRKDGAPSERP